LTPDYHVAFANRSFRERFGESRGRHCYEYCFGLSEPCDFCESYKVLETGRPHHWQVKGEDGSVIDAYDFPFTDVDGSPMILEMDMDITEQVRTKEELEKSQMLLEQRVNERTAELEFANRELDAFSHSVSHDLKAPVRAIEGFSRMLMHKYSATLESEPLRMLNIIHSNTRRMSQMIDDLLTFSRTSRKKVRKAEINLYVLTTKVFEQLRQQTPERDIKIAIGELPPAIGDPSLIEQVMVNLLANAIKFTSSRKTAVIEVGGRTEGKEAIYYVKDNGVGFNEQYAHQLYGVFQRLHSYDEYEGSGVGLSIVKSIIERHGGHVWAEGKLNEGAIFYFALPIE
jgi:light-regulated signal transduction histidine kinase (bacteriophytochrome)